MIDWSVALTMGVWLAFGAIGFFFGWIKGSLGARCAWCRPPVRAQPMSFEIEWHDPVPSENKSSDKRDQ